jgi:hypothetical protein
MGKIMPKEMNMKNAIFAAIACLMLLGCASTSVVSPLIYTDNANKDFTILGEISYEVANLGGYTDLLSAAKKKYPDCDYVIDVMIDKKATTSWAPFGGSETSITYLVRATVIKYKQSGSQTTATE